MRDQASALRTLTAQQTIERDELARSEARLQNRAKVSTSLVVTSGKGGVGKTQISVNLAIALSRLRKKVILFDADMGLANVDIVLGIHPEWHLVHVLEGIRNLEEIVVPGPEGIRIIPASSGVERLANMDRTQLKHLCYQLQAMENAADFMIVDTGAGISRTVMQFAASGDRVIVVTTGEPASFADAYATIKCVFRHNPYAKIGLLVNNYRRPGEGKDIYNRMKLMVLQFLKHPVEFLGELPYEKAFSNIVRRQRSIMMENPSCTYSKMIQGLARKIAGISGQEKPARESFFAKLISFLSRLEDA